jgi:hypothetical protein
MWVLPAQKTLIILLLFNGGNAIFLCTEVVARLHFRPPGAGERPTGPCDSSSMPFQPRPKRDNFALPQDSGIAMQNRINYLLALALPAPSA